VITINEWSSYQSYKDRRPPWIRFHRTILDNYDYQIMTADSRALLPMLWLLACEDKDPTSGNIDLDFEKIAFRLRLTKQIIIKSTRELESAGFIDCNETVTKPYKVSPVPVTTETETETETETDIAPPAFNFKKSFLSLGVDKDTLTDWLTVRKKKRASNTLTAFNSIKKEINKSGLSAQEAIEIAACNSWAGFKTEWINKKSTEINFDSRGWATNE